MLAELDAQVLKQSLEEVKTQLDLAPIFIKNKRHFGTKKSAAKYSIFQAKTAKESLEKRLNTLQEQIDMARIISPISGTVESVPLKVGQMASPGMPTSAIRVINMSTAKITADVSENFASQDKERKSGYCKFPRYRKRN